MLCFKLFDLCQPDNYKLCLIIVLVYSYLISNESGHLLCVGKPFAFLSLWATCSWPLPIFPLNFWLFSYWFIKFFYILRKRISDSCSLRLLSFISNHQLLLLYITFLTLSHLLLSCMFILSCLYGLKRKMRIRLVRKYTLNLQTVYILQDLKPERPFVCVLICFSCIWLFVTLLMDRSLPGSSGHGILQARIPEWVAMPSSRESSWPRDPTCVSYVSCIGKQVLYH